MREGRIEAPCGAALHGNEGRYERSEFLGTVPAGTAIVLIEETCVGSEFAISLVKVRVRPGPGIELGGRVGWVRLSDTCFGSLPRAPVPEFTPLCVGRLTVPIGEPGRLRFRGPSIVRPDATGFDEEPSRVIPAGCALRLLDDRVVRNWFGIRMIHVEVPASSGIAGGPGWLRLGDTSFCRTPVVTFPGAAPPEVVCRIGEEGRVVGLRGSALLEDGPVYPRSKYRGQLARGSRFKLAESHRSFDELGSSVICVEVTSSSATELVGVRGWVTQSATDIGSLPPVEDPPVPPRLSGTLGPHVSELGSLFDTPVADLWPDASCFPRDDLKPTSLGSDIRLKLIERIILLDSFGKEVIHVAATRPGEEDGEDGWIRLAKTSFMDIEREAANRAGMLGVASTRPIHEEICRILEAVHGPDHPGIALSLAKLFEIDRLEGRWEQALELGRRLLRIETLVRGAYDPRVDEILAQLANVCRKRGDRPGAVAFARWMKRPRDFGDLVPIPVLPGEREKVDETLEEIFRCQRMSYHNARKGQHIEAIALRERELELREWVYGRWHPEVARSLSHLFGVRIPIHGESGSSHLVQRADEIREMVLGSPVGDPDDEDRMR